MFVGIATSHRDPAVVFTQDIGTNPQPHPGPNRLLRHKERPKQSAARLLRHSAYLNNNPATASRHDTMKKMNSTLNE